MATDNVVALFKGAGLPVADLGQYRKALQTAQNFAPVVGNTPFLRMLKGDGTWVYGAKDTEVQPGSRWAINPTTLEIGYVAWNPKGGKPLGKQMRSIFMPPILPSELPALGGNWDENVAFELQCMNGEDKGTAVAYTANSYGGKKAFNELVAALQAQLDADPTRIVPVVLLETDSYKHPTYGLTFNPIFKIVDWIPMVGNASQTKNGAPVDDEQHPASEQEQPAAPVAEQPAPSPVQPTRQRRAAVTDVTAEVVEPKTVAAAQPEPPKQPDPPPPVQRQRRRRAAAE